MPLLSVSAAARAVKKSRGTIHNYLKSGRLSGVKDVNGNTQIDTSELLRVFGELLTDGNIAQKLTPQKMIKNSTIQHVENHGQIVEVLKEQLQIAQDREKKLMEMLEQEQAARRELEQRFIALPEGTVKKNSWLARLFGK